MAVDCPKSEAPHHNREQSAIVIRAKVIGSFFITELFLVSAIVVGCGPNREEIKQENIRQQFRTTIAAVKVCADNGSLLSEFRERRIQSETCFEANKTALGEFGLEFGELKLHMSYCEFLWNYSRNHIALNPANSAAQFEAMYWLNSAITNKLDFTWQQRESDPDFNPEICVRRALSKISDQCDKILKEHL